MTTMTATHAMSAAVVRQKMRELTRSGAPIGRLSCKV